jgi:hypothetical protein
LRRRTADPTALALQRERLKLAEHHAAMAAERERELAAMVPDRAAWQAERRVLRERAAELETQLSIRRRQHVHDALECPAPYLLASLGEPPDRPRARRTWRHAAERIEAYRFDHSITDNRRASAHDPTRHPRASTGSKHSKTSTEPSTSLASASNAASGTSYDPRHRPGGELLDSDRVRLAAIQQRAPRAQYMPDEFPRSCLPTTVGAG